jgi:uncharacterized membrane protein YdfJ with MMPL/SSD domain
MTPLGKSKHLAARMGRWSAAHWKTATFGWLAFVAAAFLIGNAIGTKQIDQNKAGSGESGHVQATLADEFKQPAGESVFIRSTTETVDSPAFRGAIADVVGALAKQPNVRQIESPLVAGHAGQIAKDRKAVLVQFKLRGTDLAQSDKDVKAIEKSVAAQQSLHSAFYIGEFGDASIDEQLNAEVGKDFAKAGIFSLPITLAVLLLAFGAFVAAGLPILLALTAIGGTIGLLALPSQLWPMDKDVSVIVLLIGLAVGVDYSMFYLKREREERRSGKSERASLEAAAATSGRSVLISGLTVMIAMAGMIFTGDKTFESFGIATMLVVGVAVLGSLTVLPALLSKLGDKVDKGRIPFLTKRLQRGNPTGESRLWNAILNPVLKHPVIATVLSAGALLALAAPALHMHTSQPGPETFPKSIPVIKVYDQASKAFPGGAIPALVMVKTGDTTTEQVRTQIAALRHDAVASGEFSEPTNVRVNAKGTIALVSLPINGKGTDAASTHALRSLRENLIPTTVGKIPGADVGVTGLTAQSSDFNKQMKHAAPFVFAFVLGFAFILLLLTFRSIVIPIKAVLLNLLSVAAAYGVLVLIFQDGYGKGFFGFSYTGGVVSFLPVFLFVILFGLSMDYHVFIVSRIREAYDRGMSTDDAVAHGIKVTASVVTSAAVVMVGVFSIFGTLSFLFLKEFGIGLAAAVLIDATIVRAVLLPAAMKLLGERNWYLPRWLEWLPEVKHETALPLEEPALAEAA